MQAHHQGCALGASGIIGARLRDGSNLALARSGATLRARVRTWLDAKFEGRVTTLEEISMGAGRLDLPVQLAGGSQVILEPKMLGAGYSRSYAKEGEEQILPYMENRDVRLGYLVVFDADCPNANS